MSQKFKQKAQNLYIFFLKNAFVLVIFYQKPFFAICFQIFPKFSTILKNPIKAPQIPLKIRP